SLASHRLMRMFMAAMSLAATAYISPRAVLAGVEKKIQSEGSQSEARRLWERAVAAKGGRERLHEVRNMEVSARAQFKRDLFQSGELRFEEFYVFPSKHWFWTDERA